jgi:SAM-dependent methyltransferase
MHENFRRYAKYYDLINKDKPYVQEALYVGGRLRGIAPGLSEVLELGSGTGRHGRLLSEKGFHVRGVELSRGMVELAQAHGTQARGSFECDVGDIRSVRLERQFDAVVALFHVMSYQTSDSDFAAVLDTAACHLPPGGLFLFDVWHAPAVLFQRPSVREKIAVEGSLRVVRKATPELRADDKVVIVNYDFSCLDSESDLQVTFSERHPMRYFFPEEVLQATSKSFSFLAVEEMLTAAPASVDTWAMTYLFQKL